MREFLRFLVRGRVDGQPLLPKILCSVSSCSEGVREGGVREGGVREGGVREGGMGGQTEGRREGEEKRRWKRRVGGRRKREGVRE